MKKFIVVLAVVVFVVLAVSGCVKFDKWFGVNESKLQLTTHVVTDAVLRGHPDRAARVVKIVTDVQGKIDAGVLITAEQVNAYVASIITQKTDLTQEDAILMNDLLAPLQDELSTAFKEMGITDPAKQIVEIDKVCTWILDIAKVIK